MPADAWFWLGILAWILWGIGEIWGWRRFVRGYHTLSHEGRLEDLEALIRSERRWFRPIVHTVLRFKSPGVLDIFLANVLFQRGKTEEAYGVAKTAVVTASSHPRHSTDAFNILGLCLVELGRYEDARAAAATCRSRTPSWGADVVEARACQLQGRFEEARDLALRAMGDPRGTIGRHLASMSLLCLGDHRAAVELLLDPSPDIKVYYSPEALRSHQATSHGRSMLELHQKTWAGVVEPLRFLYAAVIALDSGDHDSLAYCLDKVPAVMGGNPFLKSMYLMLQACRCAAEGRTEETARLLGDGRALHETPTMRTSKAEFRRYAGRALVTLGRHDEALAELKAALDLARHPLERHVTQFWIGRAWEEKGDREKALEAYRAVLADGIRSKWSAEAGAKVSPPPPSAPSPAS